MTPLICVLTVTVASGVTVPSAGIRSWMSPVAAVATDTDTGPFCPPRPPPGPATDKGCLCWMYLTSAINNDRPTRMTSKATQWRRMNATGPRAGGDCSGYIESFNTT